MPQIPNRALPSDVETDEGFGSLVGASESMRGLYGQIEQAGPSAAPVLIIGETGTGKELVARTLHELSPRKSRAYVAMNCAAVPESLVERELFGHEKGAFTGATARSPGYFEQANRGTLFLDEISAMPVSQQAKLLRVLQEGSFRRLGSGTEIAVDVRVIAAMNVDPAKAIEEGRLRPDLFYRLSVFTLHVPPLRDRAGDALLLARHFTSRLAKAEGKRPKELDSEASMALARYSWPGNVREVRNAIERAGILSRNDRIALADLPGAISRAPLTPAAGDEKEEPAARAPRAGEAAIAIPGVTLDEVKRQLIVKTLEATGSISEAARQLGISSRTIYNKINEWNLSTHSFSNGRACRS